MASSTCSSSSSVAETKTTVLEGLDEFSEANNILLMALMEETQEEEQDHDLCYADDDRLMSMIQSLEAEISSSHVGQVDGQDCSTPSSSVCTDIDWMDMEVASASSSSSPSPFDEDMIMSAWSPCAAGGDVSSEYYYSELYYGVLLENSYLPQEASDVVF